jgi:hypothetical protein
MRITTDNGGLHSGDRLIVASGRDRTAAVATNQSPANAPHQLPVTSTHRLLLLHEAVKPPIDPPFRRRRKAFSSPSVLANVTLLKGDAPYWAEACIACQVVLSLSAVENEAGDDNEMESFENLRAVPRRSDSRWIVSLIAVWGLAGGALERNACAEGGMTSGSGGPPASAVSRGGLYLSMSLGVDGLLASWREPNPVVSEGVQQLGPAIRLGVGVHVGSRVAVFIEGAGTVPAVLPGWGVEVGGIGGGTDLSLPPSSPWHVRISVRRAWAYRSRAFQAPIRFVPPPIQRIDEIGLFEIAVGHLRQNTTTHSGWMSALFGGPLWTGNGTGWMGGLSLSYTWSRW